MFILFVTLCSVIVIAPEPPSSIILPPQAENNIPNFVVNNIWGEVNYDNNVYSNSPQVDLADAITIGFHTISVDDVTFPELNVPANIEFNSAFYADPIILRNGVWQQDLVPIPTGFGSWAVEVNGFSTYQIVENDFTNGVFDDTTIIDLGGGDGITLEPDAQLILNFENANIKDDSLYSHTLTNTTSFPINSSHGLDGTNGIFFDGEVGSAFDLGGVDYNFLENGTNFTFNMWIKPVAYNKGGLYSAISTSPAEYAIDFTIWEGGGYPTFFIGNGTDYDIAQTATPAPLNEWSMLTFTWNGTHANIYQNLILKDSELIQLTGIIPTFIQTTQHRIGRSQYGSWNFNGSMDNFYVFDRVISEKEQSNLYWSNQKSVLFANEEVFPTHAFNFNNGSAYNYIEEKMATTVGGPTYNATAGHDNTGAFTFDATATEAFQYGPQGSDPWTPDGSSFTYSAWIKTANSTPRQGVLITDTISSVNGWTGMYLQSGYLRIIISNSTNYQLGTYGGLTDNEWNHVGMTYNGTHIEGYVNGIGSTPVQITLEGTVPSAYYVGNYQNEIGSTSQGTEPINGSIDSVFIYESALSDAQMFELYNESAPLYLYKQSGTYESQVFNTTAINPEIQVNVWETIDLTNYLTYTGANQSNLSNSKIYVKASNDPAFAGESYNEFTYNGSTHVPATPPGAPTGIYGQYYIELNTLDAYGLYPENPLQVIMNNYQYTMPWVTNATIPLTTPFTNDPTTGYATSSLNDTDTMQMNFFWYVNSINVFNESSTGQVNGSEADSTLASSYYVKNDVIDFIAVVCLEDQPSVCSNPVTSNNATVQNANYNYTFTPPTNSTIQITKPAGRLFKITFTSDIDNDAVVTWLVDGTQVSTTDSFTLGSSLYDDYDILTLVANITDGEFNNTETWTVEILPTEIQSVGAIALTMFILFVIGIFFFLPFFAGKFTKNEFVNLILKRGCWVIAIYLGMNAAAIMATIAENSGLPLTQEMFTYMWILGVAGYLMMGFMVLKTLFDVIDMYKTNKSSKRMGE